jgi:hypothetical protein
METSWEGNVEQMERRRRTKKRGMETVRREEDTGWRDEMG